MKLLTFNTHSIVDKDYEKKIDVLSSAILKHAPSVIALQEVMQPSKNKQVRENSLLSSLNVPVKEDNFAYRVLKKLNEHSSSYRGVYLGIKGAYGAYDEGLAIITNREITSSEATQLTEFNDYNNYKTRFALGARIDGAWFYSLHFNWWDDKDAPFINEWKTLREALHSKKGVWLMGDFNITPSSQGYGLVTQKYHDTYMLAKKIDNGITVPGDIDGWENDTSKKRIDYIFTDKSVEIKSSNTVFNGKDEAVISDHFGVLVERG